MLDSVLKTDSYFLLMFSHTTRKGKILVTEGSTGYKITYRLDPKHMTCQCRTVHQSLCPHMQYYFKHIGVHEAYFTLLYIPRIRDWIKEQKGMVSGDSINEHCLEFLKDDDGCCICMGPFGHPSSLYYCPQCYEPYHVKCYAKWNKACPRCKYVRGP